jgi:hypothetical protein
MDAAKLPKISADSHIDEPHDLWYEHMDRDLRDRAPRRIRAETGRWLDTGRRRQPGRVGQQISRGGGGPRAGRIAAVSHDARLEMLRTDCLNAEIIYPTIGLYAWNVTDPRSDGRPSRSTTTGSLSCSGVLDRHPDLHVVLVEVNAGWMAWTMSTLDEYYLAHRDIEWTKPILAALPSHYLRRQVHATFQDDPVAIHNIPLDRHRVPAVGQ